jgi:N-carbamoyl-L-amino-acid hydrolase
MPALDALRVNPDRLWQRLMRLAQCGATPAGGVNRQALSAEEIAAWRCVIGWALEAGLEPSTDAAGNLFLTLRASAGAHSNLPPLLSGSHLDSQPPADASTVCMASSPRWKR